MKSIIKILASFVVFTFISGFIFYGFSNLLGTQALAFEESNEIRLVTNIYQTSISYDIQTRKLYEPKTPRDKRAVSLERFLKLQKSELANHTDLIISLADKYKVDYKMMVAIAGLESGYCNINIGKNNCWGFGTFSWPNMETAIRDYMKRMNAVYFSKGLKTIEKIAPIYSANSSDFLEKYRYHYGLIQ